MKIYITQGVGFISSIDLDKDYEDFVRAEALKRGLMLHKYFLWLHYEQNMHMNKTDFKARKKSFESWIKENDFYYFCSQNANCQQVDLMYM
jgi:hypothetical protein